MERPSHLSHPLVRLIDEVLRLHGRLKSVFAGVNAASGLGAMELTVLTAVVAAQSAPTVAQIGRSLGHPRQVIQRAAHALLTAGLIAATPNPHHKRATLLLPTRAGTRLKRQADRRAIKTADRFLHRVSAARCKRLAGELHKLRGEIEAQVREHGA
jgi:DNA-binding MarR family transcriptional regulator